MTDELLENLEDKIKEVLSIPLKTERRETWRRHYIGEEERKWKELNDNYCNGVYHGYCNDIYHGTYYQRITYFDGKIKVIEEYRKGKRVNVKVYKI